MRTKMDLQVRIEGGRGTLQAFEDLSKTIDVSRDGLLVSTAMNGYWVGQLLQVTCPYWSTPAAINSPRAAKVIRAVLMPNSNHAVALEYQAAIHDEADATRAGNPFVSQVRVLGVESDTRLAQATSALLSQDGYQVRFVTTAKQALEIIRNETPDVIIAEAEGGEISGKDLCAIVKTNERLQHIPVILVTQSGRPSDYAAVHGLGAVVCMSKPCQPARLLQAVHLVAPPPSEQSSYSAAFNLSSLVKTSL
ncbi:MAG TPA: response regulator [Terriglobales bacterium]|nr:response regulator [Terriglobales bacterium]